MTNTCPNCGSQDIRHMGKLNGDEDSGNVFACMDCQFVSADIEAFRPGSMLAITLGQLAGGGHDITQPSEERMQ